ncbi:MAG: polysaccharide biosynthesis protein [Candidatus Wildermuthbacteria bacterium RIFCSPHIGHO2_01_FULL_49_22b]|uniref:Polysaccharide biosynthesis protein n=1 Tax=Candidatus Wildermuthbacteria bacterium RIFCSPHIGHO2_01_FULL_49_22b TaxID=1802448 RepID=A0A1G2QWW8_9BACT|nr:MAG: polysaccharide biosynthesis protein [Candidatus Wildermuthbacteria bacterium RIFCSPHIGHO2_01_FULL_49_22b]
MKIPLARPSITEKERRAVAKVLETSQLSLGRKQREFEKRLAEQAGRKHAVVVNSGTAALHLIVRALDIGKGDEVITTPFSFIASSNCILYEGATPVFCDIKEKTRNIDASQIEKKITKKTKAILAVDVFGHPADWDAILKIAAKHKLKVIEDSAEAIGSAYKGRPCGSFGDASIFSFYPNKQITTSEGGAVLTNLREIADLCRSMANQGRKIEGGKWLEHVRLGYNYRMPEMEAALGIAQLSRLSGFVRKRARVASLYNELLSGVPNVEIPSLAPHVTKMSWFVYVIALSKRYSRKNRDRILESLRKQSIQCGTYFQSIHLQPLYQKEFGYKKGMFPVAESLSGRTIALPFYPDLTAKEVVRVCSALARCL